IESLSNGSYNISVNNQDKYLVVSQRSKQKMEKKPAIMPLMLMAKIEKYAKYSIATHLEKNEHGLCVEPKFGEIEKMEYYYNTTTNLPTRCVLFYRNVLRNGLPEAIKQPKVILRFTKIDTKPNFGKGVFSELKYFKIAPNKKRIILQAAYSSYKMMGQ
ncbi:MAG: hypothetical protein RI894_194, partial [Bacteroidota bacterium]